MEASYYWRLEENMFYERTEQGNKFMLGSLQISFAMEALLWWIEAKFVLCWKQIPGCKILLD